MRPTSAFTRLRRRLALAGGRPADLSAESAHGRRDHAGYRPSTLIEGELQHHAVGHPVPWQEPIAFLDGTQHVELVGYHGTTPIVAAVVRAAVRRRDARRMTVAVQSSRRLVVSRAAALAALDGVLDDHEAIALEEDGDPPHPIRDLDRAHALVDRARGGVELAVAKTFRREDPTRWLLVDGSLTMSPDWSNDPRMLGIIKSHAVLPFEGAELERYLTLPVGHRSSVFQPASRAVTPVFAWGLRLHAFAGRDLFHGLVRIEAMATPEMVMQATQLSQHLLAERAPLAADPRADRLLYGIHDVERFLRAQGG